MNQQRFKKQLYVLKKLFLEKSHVSILAIFSRKSASC